MKGDEKSVSTGRLFHALTIRSEKEDLVEQQFVVKNFLKLETNTDTLVPRSQDPDPDRG